MPKFIDARRCDRCARCVLGCRRGAKWTTLGYLDEAVSHGAETLYGATVHEVVVEDGRARGVNLISPEGRAQVRAGTVILAAGGLASPAILQRCGLKEAGAGLFVDLFVNTYGVARDVGQAAEPTMTLVDDEFRRDGGFIISPFINPRRLVRVYELGLRGAMMPSDRLLGIMTKIADEPGGRVHPDGAFTKGVTPRDRARLEAGSGHARKILTAAGVDPKSLSVTRVQGAHPGGTAAVGKVVDAELQTRVEGLFVCDASVLPVAPGLPPILTICALAKRLGRRLAA
jgi:choline dehydrogenase-like flavoprotein